MQCWGAGGPLVRPPPPAPVHVRRQQYQKRHARRCRVVGTPPRCSRLRPRQPQPPLRRLRVGPPVKAPLPAGDWTPTVVVVGEMKIGKMGLYRLLGVQKVGSAVSSNDNEMRVTSIRVCVNQTRARECVSM